MSGRLSLLASMALGRKKSREVQALLVSDLLAVILLNFVLQPLLAFTLYFCSTPFGTALYDAGAWGGSGWLKCLCAKGIATYGGGSGGIPCSLFSISELSMRSMKQSARSSLLVWQR